MKTLPACLLSACLASFFTLWLNGSVAPTESVSAQEAERNTDRTPPFLPPLTRTDPREIRANEGTRVAPVEREGRLEPANARLTAPAPFDATGALTEDGSVAVRVYDAVNPSVVNITTEARERGGFGLDGGLDRGSGSGTIIDATGRILTNYHVVEGADRIEVTLSNGDAFEADVLGFDPLNDLAVLSIDPGDVLLRPVTFADSSRLRVGMQCFAIGNPFGLERTMSAGIVSSLNRTLPVRNHRSIRSIVQTDAAVNPGNSGGPLLNARGEVIGINVAIASQTGQSAGVGFAIPSNLCQRVAAMLIEHGHVIRPDAGIRKIFETDDGILIEELDPEGPAKEAGLRGPVVTREVRGPYVVVKRDRRRADVILGVDGQRTPTADDFLTYIEGKQPGDRVTITVLRSRKEVDVDVVLRAGR